MDPICYLRLMRILQESGCFRKRTSNNGTAVRELAPSNLQRPGDIRERRRWAAVEMIDQSAGGSIESGGSFRREHKQLMIAIWGCRRNVGRLLHDDMRVRPANAERADARTARRAGSVPRVALRARDERTFGQVKLRIGRYEVDQRRNDAMS